MRLKCSPVERNKVTNFSRRTRVKGTLPRPPTSLHRSICQQRCQRASHQTNAMEFRKVQQRRLRRATYLWQQPRARRTHWCCSSTESIKAPETDKSRRRKSQQAPTKVSSQKSTVEDKSKSASKTSSKRLKMSVKQHHNRTELVAHPVAPVRPQNGSTHQLKAASIPKAVVQHQDVTGATVATCTAATKFKCLRTQPSSTTP